MRGSTTPEDAVRALRPDGDLYRIELHLEGPDPRVALRETIPEDFAELRAKVERLPWGFEYLRADRDHPEVRAEELAAVARAGEARLQAARAAAEGARPHRSR